jgi:hypothetical protein
MEGMLARGSDGVATQNRRGFVGRSGFRVLVAEAKEGKKGPGTRFKER